ncbi:hypothetical protein Tco_1172268, partial [Tanacetum coccineum]
EVLNGILQSSIPQLEYPPQINQQSEFSQQDSSLIVPVFQRGDDPIDAINHMMSFLTADMCMDNANIARKRSKRIKGMSSATIANSRDISSGNAAR